MNFSLQGLVDQTLANAVPIAPVTLSYFADCSQLVPKQWLIKGVMAKGETSSWIGPPGSGKSALITDMVVCSAAEEDWRGYRTKERAGWVYFAFERADLVKRRLTAYVQRGHQNLPIAIGGEIIDLMNPTCIQTMAATIKAAEDRFGLGVGGMVIDTYAKGIAAGNGDEDKARDQSRVLANLRHLHEQFSMHMSIVGHTGKDEGRGARGSNAHLADVDVMVQIRSSGQFKTADVIKANDQPDGVLTTFKLDVCRLGLDEDGDDITAAIVSDQVIEAPTTAAEPNLTKNQGTMYTLLHDAEPNGLTTEQWNQKAREADIGVRRKADHYDLRSALQAKRLVRQFNGMWHIAV